MRDSTWFKMIASPKDDPQAVSAGFLADVHAGLGAPVKAIPPKYFYDAVGSALFEAITHLPEYGLTRADERLLRKHAPEVAALGTPDRIIELGSGSGRKTRWILEAFGNPVYCPIDVSPTALEQCRRDLERSARVIPCCAAYLDGLAEITRTRGSGPLLVLFLGSTIGNFEPVEALRFLRSVREHLRQGDRLLIGFDLVKDRAVLMDAYDDPAGVTAAFNKNLLSRINRELGANFDLKRFEHEVRYDPVAARVEMHLRSSCEQDVRVGDRAFAFRKHETIWTESSYKSQPYALKGLASNAGFIEEHQWVDAEWPFAECLWLVN